ncbi:MAG: fumarate hydratase C-terminal domain-containing protein [Candidatus Omnitrophica bacterium]|nr:fumarate hydratase C-terminal domain-containing protein [Candidatus Omnitrophota bacterium]
MKKIVSPITKSGLSKLKCGEEVLFTGTVYTARDAAHKKLTELIAKGKKTPFDLKNTIIYYAGPTPQRPDGTFGSCGPTTASRMDKFTPPLLAKGLAAMIGKGKRSVEVAGYIKKYGAVYFLAAGGAGAYLAKKIVSATLLAFGELGPEAIYRLKVENFPLIVGIDSSGNDVYQ